MAVDGPRQKSNASSLREMAALARGVVSLSLMFFSNRGGPMFQRLIDDFKDSTGTALRLTSLAAAAAVALFVTTSFLCAAAFIFVLQQYGPVEACLTGAAHLLRGHADRGRQLHGAQAPDQAACRAGREIGGAQPCWPIRCWSPPASRSSARSG